MAYKSLEYSYYNLFVHIIMRWALFFEHWIETNSLKKHRYAKQVQQDALHKVLPILPCLSILDVSIYFPSRIILVLKNLA